MGKLIFIAVLLVAGYFFWIIASETAGVRACYEKNADQYEAMEINKVKYATTLQEECEATYDAVTQLGSCLRIATTSATPFVAKKELADIAFEVVRLIRPGLRTIIAYTNDHNEACSAYDYFMIP